MINIFDRYLTKKIDNNMSDASKITQYKDFVQKYNLYVTGVVNQYYQSSLDGYMNYNIAKQICPKLTDNDWTNIKHKIYNFENYKALKIKFPDSKDEMCKLFSEHIIEHYGHLIN